MVKIAPSILAADFSCLREQIAIVEEAGAEYLHLDIMDGHFVPNITFGPPVIAALRPHSKLVFDVHLMINEPGRYLDDFIRAGADLLVVHPEACPHLHRTLDYIKDKGLRAGAALNPSTPPQVLEYVVPLLDLVLVMTVNPGFGGQSFIPWVLTKITALKEILDSAGSKAEIQVDGGVNVETAGSIARAGATVLVAGSAIFNRPDPAEAVREIRASALAGVSSCP
ncbi:MAG: ribulose-phosphate 3-epimerase [Bacillota bacterium]